MQAESVAILLSSLKFGGAERVALSLARAFRATGIDVRILVMSMEGEFLAEAEQEFEVVDLACDRTRKLPLRLVKHLSAHNSDILLSSFWKLNLCACIARLLVPNLVLLLWEHSPPSVSKNSPRFLYALTASLLYRMARRVICVSGGVYEDVARWTVGLRSRLTVIHNPIPPPPVSLNLPASRSGRKRIAWVGRLDDPKNPMLLLDAFAMIASRIDAGIVYVGDGPQRSQLEQRCIDLGIEDRVQFAGFVDSPYRILADCDLLVLTSDREGFGNVLVEAMHCGLAVVATDCGRGVHEIILDSKYGKIVPTRDPEALAEAIEQALAGPTDPSEQIVGGRRFLPAAIAQQFLAAACAR
jgi:glycosyltransferase involved in cell wall biosynthesis